MKRFRTIIYGYVREELGLLDRSVLSLDDNYMVRSSKQLQ